MEPCETTAQPKSFGKYSTMRLMSGSSPSCVEEGEADTVTDDLAASLLKRGRWTTWMRATLAFLW